MTRHKKRCISDLAALNVARKLANLKPLKKVPLWPHDIDRSHQKQARELNDRKTNS